MSKQQMNETPNKIAGITGHLPKYPANIRNIKCDCGHTLSEHAQGCYAKVEGWFCGCRKTPKTIARLFNH